VAVKASNFNKEQQVSTSGRQQVQYQSLENLKFQQSSIGFGIWFGTRGLEVQILSPRPIFSMIYGVKK
jgi:hypothetical protein